MNRRWPLFLILLAFAVTPQRVGGWLSVVCEWVQWGLAVWQGWRIYDETPSQVDNPVDK